MNETNFPITRYEPWTKTDSFRDIPVPGLDDRLRNPRCDVDYARAIYDAAAVDLRSGKVTDAVVDEAYKQYKILCILSIEGML